MQQDAHCFSKFVGVQAPAWPPPQGELALDKAPVPLPKNCEDGESSGRPQSLTPFGTSMERALLAVCEALIAAAPRLDDLDSRRVALRDFVKCCSSLHRHRFGVCEVETANADIMVTQRSQYY